MTMVPAIAGVNLDKLSDDELHKRIAKIVICARILLFTNLNRVNVVAISFCLQVLSQHNAILGRFLKTSSMPFGDCLLLLALGAIPLFVLELVKVVRHAPQQHPQKAQH